MKNLYYFYSLRELLYTKHCEIEFHSGFRPHYLSTKNRLSLSYDAFFRLTFT